MSLLSNDEDMPLFEGTLREKGVPGLTKWRPLFGSRYFWVIEGNEHQIRMNNTILRMFPVGLELIILAVTYYRWWIGMFPVLPGKNWWGIGITFCWLSGVGCMIKTWLSDPGYLPFFYPASGKTKFTEEELRYGTAVSDEQRSWARRQNRPARVHWSPATGRYIIRGDHFCSFMGNWVGLYNHRYFFISVSYLICYILIYFAGMIWQAVHSTIIFSVWEMALYVIIGVCFLLLLSNNWLHHLVNISFNFTVVDIIMKRRTNFDKGVINNWEDVCGPRKYMWLWWLPIPLPRSIDGFNYGPIDESILNETKILHLDEPDPKIDNAVTNRQIYQPSV